MFQLRAYGGGDYQASAYKVARYGICGTWNVFPSKITFRGRLPGAPRESVVESRNLMLRAGGLLAVS